MTAPPLVFATASYAYLGDDLVRAGRFEPGAVEITAFPDGERYQRVDTPVSGRDVVLVAGTISDADTLELEVSDDGPGFGGNGSGRRGAGVGLGHTRERLSLLYGSRGTLTVGDRDGGGGSVRIRIPWRVESAAGNPA